VRGMVSATAAGRPRSGRAASGEAVQDGWGVRGRRPSKGRVDAPENVRQYDALLACDADGGAVPAAPRAPDGPPLYFCSSVQQEVWPPMFYGHHPRG